MPERVEIMPNELLLPVFGSWEERWWLLTAGRLEAGAFNTMTVAWGSLGVMWRRPFAMVVVRPTRHTYAFMEQNPDFTLSLFPSAFRETLVFCGSHSGRDTDKIATTGLHPIPSTSVASPAFDEAELILECRSIYRDDFDPRLFGADFIEPCYPGKDYHRFYFGEILAVRGEAQWRSPS